jgi:hypothetical protein
MHRWFEVSTERKIDTFMKAWMYIRTSFTSRPQTGNVAWALACMDYDCLAATFKSLTLSKIWRENLWVVTASNSPWFCFTHCGREGREEGLKAFETQSFAKISNFTCAKSGNFFANFSCSSRHLAHRPMPYNLSRARSHLISQCQELANLVASHMFQHWGASVCSRSCASNGCNKRVCVVNRRTALHFLYSFLLYRIKWVLDCIALLMNAWHFAASRTIPTLKGSSIGLFLHPGFSIVFSHFIPRSGCLRVWWVGGVRGLPDSDDARTENPSSTSHRSSPIPKRRDFGSGTVIQEPRHPIHSL